MTDPTQWFAMDSISAIVTHFDNPTISSNFLGKSSTLIAHLTGQISDSACSFVAQLRIDKITKIGRIDLKEYKLQPTGSSKAINATDEGVKNTYKTTFDAKHTLF